MKKKVCLKNGQLKSVLLCIALLSSALMQCAEESRIARTQLEHKGKTFESIDFRPGEGDGGVGRLFNPYMLSWPDPVRTPGENPLGRVATDEEIETLRQDLAHGATADPKNIFKMAELCASQGKFSEARDFCKDVLDGFALEAEQGRFGLENAIVQERCKLLLAYCLRLTGNFEESLKLYAELRERYQTPSLFHDEHMFFVVLAAAKKRLKNSILLMEWI